MLKKLVTWIFIYGACSAQSSWEPTWGPNFNTIYNIHKASNYLFMASEFSCYRSPDGINWQKLNIPNTYVNYQVTHFNSSGSRVFAMGNGLLLHSDDWGLTWVQDSIQNPTRSYVTGSHVYIITNNAVYHSPNSGISWQYVASFNNAQGITFFQNKLYVAGDNGKIFNSADSGATWQQVATPFLGSIPVFSYEDNNLYNDNDNFLYASNNYGLYRTPSETGQWVNISLAPQNYMVMNYSVDNSKIYIGGSSFSFVSPKNNISWQQVSKFVYTSSLLSYNPYLFAGTQDGLYRSSDNGVTWNKQYRNIIPGQQVTNVILNKGILWAFNARSTDKGNTWEHHPLPDSMKLLAYSGNMLVTEVNKSYFSERYASPDNGTTWNKLTLHPSGGLFINKQHLYVSSNNAIFKSTDLGTTWAQVKNTGCFSFVGLDSIIFITAPEGLLKSTDDGASWQICNTGLSNSNPQWVIYAGNALYVKDIYSPPYRSADMGQTWTALPSAGLNISMRTCMAASSDRVFVSGYSYGSYGSENYNGIFELVLGDSSWHWLGNDSITHTECMIVHENYLFAAIGYEGLQRYKLGPDVINSIETTGIEKILSAVPNPCDDEFNITTGGKAGTVSVYDLFGREVRQLKISGGEEQVRINTSALPEGVYFVRTRDHAEDPAGSKTAKVVVEHR